MQERGGLREQVGVGVLPEHAGPRTVDGSLEQSDVPHVDRSANGGARDAPILALHLDVSNPKTGLTARFEATYTADAAYFASTGAKRPKTPFSALVIAGRSAWTGTVLFYPVSYSNEKALAPITRGAAQEVRQRNGRRQQHQHTA